jgi:hypothetical protein
MQGLMLDRNDYDAWHKSRDMDDRRAMVRVRVLFAVHIKETPT